MESKRNTYILAKFDVSGIQQYIFATNRLRENVGASSQVTKILEEYLPIAIGEETDPQKRTVLEWEKESKLRISEDERIEVEIVYIGGGNAMVIFRSREVFQNVCKNLGAKVAKNCQGLYLNVAHESVHLEDFKRDVTTLDKKMAKNKANMVRQPIYSPFPVVEQDNSNHQPITRCYCYRKDEEMLSTSFNKVENMTEMRYQKWMAYRELGRDRRELLKDIPFLETHNLWHSKCVLKGMKMYPALEGLPNYDYPVEMDELCRNPGENSHIAVVHIDGNGMGEQIREILCTYKEYEKAVPMLREKSKEISSIFRNTYKALLLRMFANSEAWNQDKEKAVFRLRPIVLDGDDFTFLCTADLALPIAACFLTELTKSQQKKEKKITACAGIAFVHSHFPFYEAYKIAEESCSAAKSKWYAERGKKDGSQENCFLDFRVIKGSEVGGTQRHEEWQMRPYYVGIPNGKSRPDSLFRLYEMIKKMEEDWPSNRLHKIQRAMLAGEEQVTLLNSEFSSRSYSIKKLAQTDKWKDSLLYDALEIRGLCNVKLMTKLLNMKEKQGNEYMEVDNKIKK